MIQLCLPGMDMFRPRTWKPNPVLLSKLKSYLAGYAAHGREIRATRQYIADKIGTSKRTLSRLLAHLRDSGWAKTVARTARGAIRKVLQTIAQSQDGTPSGTSHPIRHVNTQVESKSSGLEFDRSQDDSEYLPEVRKAAGMERISEGDRRYLAALQRAGTDPEAIRAGILLGRARKLVSCANRGIREEIRSVRYFAATIAEAAAGLPAGYTDHLEAFLRRHAA